MKTRCVLFIFPFNAIFCVFLNKAYFVCLIELYTFTSQVLACRQHNPCFAFCFFHDVFTSIAGSEPKTYRCWSLKCGLPSHSPSLWGKRAEQIIQWLSIFNGPNQSGPQPKTKLLWVRHWVPKTKEGWKPLHELCSALYCILKETFCDFQSNDWKFPWKHRWHFAALIRKSRTEMWAIAILQSTVVFDNFQLFTQRTSAPVCTLRETGLKRRTLTFTQLFLLDRIQCDIFV